MPLPQPCPFYIPFALGVDFTAVGITLDKYLVEMKMGILRSLILKLVDGLKAIHEGMVIHNDIKL